MAWNTMRERWADQTAPGPYCLACETMARMVRTERGFLCDPASVDPVPVSLRALGVPLRDRRGCGTELILAATEPQP